MVWLLRLTNVKIKRFGWMIWWLSRSWSRWRFYQLWYVKFEVLGLDLEQFYGRVRILVFGSKKEWSKYKEKHLTSKHQDHQAAPLDNKHIIKYIWSKGNTNMRIKPKHQLTHFQDIIKNDQSNYPTYEPSNLKSWASIIKHQKHHQTSCIWNKIIPTAWMWQLENLESLL